MFTFSMVFYQTIMEAPFLGESYNINHNLPVSDHSEVQEGNDQEKAQSERNSHSR